MSSKENNGQGRHGQWESVTSVPGHFVPRGQAPGSVPPQLAQFQEEQQQNGRMRELEEGGSGMDTSSPSTIPELFPPMSNPIPPGTLCVESFVPLGLEGLTPELSSAIQVLALPVPPPPLPSQSPSLAMGFGVEGIGFDVGNMYNPLQLFSPAPVSTFPSPHFQPWTTHAMGIVLGNHHGQPQPPVLTPGWPMFPPPHMPFPLQPLPNGAPFFVTSPQQPTVPMPTMESPAVFGNLMADQTHVQYQANNEPQQEQQLLDFAGSYLQLPPEPTPRDETFDIHTWGNQNVATYPVLQCNFQEPCSNINDDPYDVLIRSMNSVLNPMGFNAFDGGRREDDNDQEPGSSDGAQSNGF